MYFLLQGYWRELSTEQLVHFIGFSNSMVSERVARPELYPSSCVGQSVELRNRLNVSLIITDHIDRLHTVVRGWLVSLPNHQCFILAQVLEFLLLTLIFFDCPSGENSGRVSCSAIKPDNSGSPSFVAMTQTQAWAGSLASHTPFRKSKVKVQTLTVALCCSNVAGGSNLSTKKKLVFPFEQTERRVQIRDKAPRVAWGPAAIIRGDNTAWTSLWSPPPLWCLQDCGH